MSQNNDTHTYLRGIHVCASIQNIYIYKFVTRTRRKSVNVCRCKGHIQTYMPVYCCSNKCWTFNVNALKNATVCSKILDNKDFNGKYHTDIFFSLFTHLFIYLYIYLFTLICSLTGVSFMSKSLQGNSINNCKITMLLIIRWLC